METQQQPKEYFEPQLIEYGSLSEITKSSGNGTGDGFNSQSQL